MGESYQVYLNIFCTIPKIHCNILRKTEVIIIYKWDYTLCLKHDIELCKNIPIVTWGEIRQWLNTKITLENKCLVLFIILSIITDHYNASLSRTNGWELVMNRTKME